MTIKTYSAFGYGHQIIVENNFLPFSENGVDELVGELRLEGYTIGDLADEMARAMNEVGTLNYTASLDRNTGLITIAGDSNFYLYVTSSSLSGASVYPILGFTSERSGSDTYEGNSRSGSIFYPQFYLQKYVDFVDFQSPTSSTISESATGKIQVVKYQDVNYMECNITLQTNIPQSKDSIIRNANGYDELLAFMQYAVLKQPLEFYPNADDLEENVTECLLESTSTDSKGTGFKLIELYSRGFAEWFETGTIKFRDIK